MVVGRASGRLWGGGADEDGDGVDEDGAGAAHDGTGAEGRGEGSGRPRGRWPEPSSVLPSGRQRSEHPSCHLPADGEGSRCGGGGGVEDMDHAG